MELNINTKSNHNDTAHTAHIKFHREVIDGLKSNPKTLPSKYFYDKNGDGLFQQIMAMPEYYLTKCELDIFCNKTVEIANMLTAENEPFDLIEMGAGDAMKSSYLLKELMKRGVDFTYMPIDISDNILTVLHNKLKADMPKLAIVSLKGEYFDMLYQAASLSQKKKVVLFLGSNIGNMEFEDTFSFCRELNKNLSPDDILLMGFDLKKNPQTILNAYHDKMGITAAFNLNLLTRINREIEADFQLDQFQHYPHYDPITGACRSYLISLVDQQVQIGEEKISFAKNEPIYMEVSQKFSMNDIEQLAQNSCFNIIGEITDSKNWFVDSFWKKI
ncbi:L-histidine N(alpha)-methyltransferase [Sphingobacterium sp. SRCM116780]|uniref:L-histidine N(alpha)-methyltransferase n=1 Tax=Sphingobacterium sp. SRCM116780 TaxID=2907623 RepID=UPI001F3BAA51|nr:L-histidine N(alpha)-methyltransferase [Sphingobacterium sp. SRCM116780]UIR57284.1 L-histidine N(alpha)-methyltransferase [Sphingobacterium sp. SRCM116780]